MPETIKIGPNAIAAYSRLNYFAWYALAEFIDNSTQSYLNNQEDLDQVYKDTNTTLTVSILCEDNLIQVTDNSIGMNRAELIRGLEFNNTTHQTKGRSRYGLGMKTAAFWFGNKWTITTGKLGEPNMYRVVFDLDRINNNDYTFDVVESPKDTKAHFTVIKVENLNRQIKGRTLGRTKEFLSSIYRVDIRTKRLSLVWNQTELPGYNPIEKLAVSQSGTQYRRDFSFQVNGKSVTGWVGVFEKGDTKAAGFTLLQHDRVIVGYPDQYKPASVFGQQGGSNTLVNQRLVGEIHLDDFEVTHTKDGIAWQHDEEEIFTVELEKVAREYKKFAADRRSTDKSHLKSEYTEMAINQFKQRLESNDISNLLKVYVPLSAETLTSRESSVVEKVERDKPLATLTVGDHTVTLTLATANISENDPYLSMDKPGDNLEVVINGMHPIFRLCENADSLYMFLILSIYDAVAEYKADDTGEPIEPVKLRHIKDNLLRLPLSPIDSVSLQE